MYNGPGKSGKCVHQYLINISNLKFQLTSSKTSWAILSIDFSKTIKSQHQSDVIIISVDIPLTSNILLFKYWIDCYDGYDQNHGPKVISKIHHSLVWNNCVACSPGLWIMQVHIWPWSHTCWGHMVPVGPQVCKWGKFYIFRLYYNLIFRWPLTFVCDLWPHKHMWLNTTKWGRQMW